MSMPQFFHLGLPPHLVQTVEALQKAPILDAGRQHLPGVGDGVILTPVSHWRSLSPTERHRLEAGARPLVLVADTSAEDALDAFAQGRFVAVLTLPLTQEKFRALNGHLHEMFQVQADMQAMAREIALERELLLRKNEELSFVNGVLRRASTSLDVGTILAHYIADVQTLISVHQAAAVLWTPTTEGCEADFLLPGAESRVHEQWINHLAHTMERLGGGVPTAYRRGILPGVPALHLAPEERELFTQTFQTDGTTFGALVLCTEGLGHLGRDRIHTLHAAANHVALALRNALRFHRVKTLADHDGLTRIANRHSFDRRLREEIKRHQRHGQELSLLMLDLDFFKAVNDRYGHLAGDMVLSRVGDLLRHSLRESDLPARFGGEEFVVLLPQTTEEQAWLLAERIRSLIAKQSFSFEGQHFRVTASIGVAALRPGALTPPELLIHEADQALYQAKNSGRNMVCVSSLGQRTCAPSPQSPDSVRSTTELSSPAYGQ